MHDHRTLGRELGLFDNDPLIGAGLPYWLPDGAAVRHALEEYIRDAERRAGYRHVYSPILGKRELYELSGHWEHYRDDMFPPMDLGSEQVVLRPSLCPHHAVIYRSRARSYRELPLRLAELGGMYRSELSGVLGGLTRVRAIQLNDAHIFCTLDQVAGEAAAALELIGSAHEAMGIRASRYRLSLPGPGGKYVAGPDLWERATEILVDVLDRSGVDYQAVPGEAAFYGPQIDVQIADAAGRESTLSTVQVDLYQPQQFDLRYVGPDGGRHRPVMVHRSIIGSVERAVAHLIEVHGGAFPAWLAPVQLVVLPVADDAHPAAAALVQRCLDRGLRADLAGVEHGSLGARIRAARLVPYQVVIGAREAAGDVVAVRLRDGRRLDAVPVEELLDRVEAVVRSKSGQLWPDQSERLDRPGPPASAVG
jgi:threonyl-tRNA synthetase